MTGSETIESVRSFAAGVILSSLRDAQGLSETEWANLLCDGLVSNGTLYPSGWYDPPPNGISVLIGKDRMAFDSIRKQEYWPRADVCYDVTTPAIIYVSPVDKRTQLFGDIGLTIYQGADEKIRNHLKRSRDAIVTIAEKSRVGMSFAQLHAEGLKTLRDYKLEHAVMATITPQASDSNFGHTVPWADNEDAPGELSFGELREQIRLTRRFINAEEVYVINRNSAFTLESRLVEPQNSELPNVFFHVIVTFSDGKKNILTNFEKIFRNAGMDYML